MNTAYFEEYLAEIRNEILAGGEEISRLAERLAEAYAQNEQIYVIGNGGSAATANHFACDLEKNVQMVPGKYFNICSLCESVEKITAYSNDFTYETYLSRQLEMRMKAGDILIVISASGNSDNLIEACRTAKDLQATVVSLSGFPDPRIARFADIAIALNLQSYEQAEDAHLTILHIIIKYLKESKQLSCSSTFSTKSDIWRTSTK